MGKEDIYESDLLDDERVFADLVNGVLYHGEQVVKPEELTEQDGELRSIVNNRMRKTVRDKVRLWKGRSMNCWISGMIRIRFCRSSTIID